MARSYGQARPLSRTVPFPGFRAIVTFPYFLADVYLVILDDYGPNSKFWGLARQVGDGSWTAAPIFGPKRACRRPKNRGRHVPKSRAKTGKIALRRRNSRIFGDLGHFSACFFRRRDFNHQVHFVGRTNFNTPFNLAWRASDYGQSCQESSHEDRDPAKRRQRHRPDQETGRGRFGSADGRSSQEPQLARCRRLHPSRSFEDREEEGSRSPGPEGRKNPFTGELQDRPAKPAYSKVKVRALRNLKDMVAK